jgi:phosphatidylglycerol---prolipoprotein diacylglyceryl transferase
MTSFVQVGPFTIYFYSLFIIVGTVAGYFLARPEARRFRISADELKLSIGFGAIPGFIGARLYHVIDQWSLYADDPLSALAIWNGGLGILGGLAGGVLGLLVFSRIFRKPFLRVLDVWAPSVLLAQALGRFGNWTNQEAFGPPTDRPWGIFITPENRPEAFADSSHFHPTFFYEAGLDFLGLGLLLLLRPRLRAKSGAVLGAYLVIYAVGRFIVEFYRVDTAHLGGLAVAHLVSVVLVGLGAWLWLRPARVESAK